MLARSILFVAAFGGLAACVQLDTARMSSEPGRPALDVLSLDFERTNFRQGAVVSGAVAEAQRRVLVSTPTFGRFRRDAKGPIPTEVRVDVTRLVTRGNTVTMEGTLSLRDLGLGKTLATLPNFSASGVMPAAGSGARLDGFVFRGVEGAVLSWLGGLECDTGMRVCGPKKVAAAAAAEVETPTVEGADLTLENMVGNRTTSLRRINTGGIDPDQIVAAAAPQPTAAESATGPTSIGRTTAALGLLDRSGFWLQTPLVSSEATGEVVASNGRRITVTLIPKSGPSGGGSQISLAGLRELGFGPTDLVSLEVFR